MTKQHDKGLSNNLIKKIDNIPYLTIHKEGWKLATKGFENFDQKYCRKQQLKIVVYTFLYPKFSYKWFQFIKSPNFSPILNQRPVLYVKPYRPYISTKWNKKQKIKVIQDNYNFLKNKGNLLSKLLNANKVPIIIAEVQFKNDFVGYLKLGYDYRYRKEGELVLFFDCDKLGGRIISASFSFEELKKDFWVCYIGCVQGTNINAENSIKLLQKLMYGLRPNSFIIYTLQELASNLGCNEIYGVGNAIQAYRKKHFIHIPWIHNIHFDYNTFWEELNGKKMEKGWYKLPLIPVRKNIQDIKSKKRSMYKKRYNMLDAISSQISNFVKKIEVKELN